MLLNGFLDRRGIDLAISAYIGRHKKSSFFNKNHERRSALADKKARKSQHRDRC